jgi:hypothetical protein
MANAITRTAVWVSIAGVVGTVLGATIAARELPDQ